MFGSWFGGKSGLPEGWIALEAEAQLDDAISASFDKPVVLFKHSTRCGISSMAYDRLRRGWEKNQDTFQFYYLDLLRFRPLSNGIAKRFGVHHESPQAIVLEKGQVKSHVSHNQVDFNNF
ncbi:bacillithiol system redox-active protein YtxJ [bacterium SCSIO 12741]|nr:bacillithiol system redox-active protein YtxJ [bacterium SCSIO 12741]